MATNGSQNIPTGFTGTILQGAGVGSAPIFSTATYPSTAGTSLNLLQSDGTNFVSTAPLIYNTGNLALTNSQIKGMFVTPVQLIATPGSGKIILVIAWVIKLVYGGTNQFTGGGLIQLVDGSGDVIAASAAATNLTGSTSTYCIKGSGTNAATTSTNFANSAILINNATGAFTGNAANDNTALVSITYQILTI